MEKPGARGFRRVPAVDRAARVLKCFSSSQEELGVSELAARVGAQKGSLHQILLTLCDHGLLARNPATRRYRLGYGLLELGAILLSGMDVRSVAKPHLLALAQQTGETASLGVLDGYHVVIVDREESSRQVRVAANIGVRMPLFAGSFAKVLLGCLPDGELNGLLATNALPRFTDRSPTDLIAYRAEIEAARARGWAMDDGEYLEGVCAISAPVRGLHGRIVAAISVVGYAPRMADHRWPELLELTLRTAEDISLQLGQTQAVQSHARRRG